MGPINKDTRDAWILRLQNDYPVFRVAGAAEAIIDKLIEDPDFDGSTLQIPEREPVMPAKIEVVTGAESEAIWASAREEQLYCFENEEDEESAEHEQQISDEPSE